MVDHLESIRFKVLDPLLAASAVRVTMHIDCERLSRLRDSTNHQAHGER
jgi:hypothetical protein